MGHDRMGHDMTGQDRAAQDETKKASKWGYWATINEFNSKTDPRPPADSGFLHRSLQRLLYGGLDAVRRLQLRTRSRGVDEGVRKDLGWFVWPFPLRR